MRLDDVEADDDIPHAPIDATCPQCGGFGEYCVEIVDYISDGRDDYETRYYYRTLAERVCYHPFHPSEPIYDMEEAA